MKSLVTMIAALLVAAGAAAQRSGDRPIPPFKATALTGEVVDSAQLIGQPTVLIVMPSRDAAEETRRWADALRRMLDQDAIRIRAVLTIDLPFFMSEQDALSRAKEKVPERYHDQTWLSDKTVLEKALDIPSNSHKAFVLVLDPDGAVLVQVSGAPSDRRVKAVTAAVQSMK